MKKVIFSLLFACLLSAIGCAGISTVGSENNKVTILYFEGGRGQIHHSSDNFLINRSKHLFSSKGINVTSMALDFPYPSLKRYTDRHFRNIQKKVNKLIDKGHNSIWLMGISMGSQSILHAGSNHIQGVDGLIVINPPSLILWGEMKKVKLPILGITHEEDYSPFKDLSVEDFKKIYSSSIRPEIVVFSGGHTGTGYEASRDTQKYQHGLRGLEQKFVNAVIDFIDSNSQLKDD